MKCSKCGTEIEENARFCPKCGMAVSAGQESQPNNAVPDERNGASAKKPLMKHPGFIFLAIAVVLVIVLGILFQNRSWLTVILLMVARHPGILIFIMALMIAAVVIAVYRSILRKHRQKASQEIAQCVLADSDINKFSQYFVNKDETYISSLGNGFAVISNKRVYFKGNCFSGSGKSLVKTDEERTVDVKDITGSGFLYRRYLGILLGLLTALIGLITGSVFTVKSMFSNWDDVAYYQDEINFLDSKIAEYQSRIDELTPHKDELYEQMCSAPYSSEEHAEYWDKFIECRDEIEDYEDDIRKAQQDRNYSSNSLHNAKGAAPAWTALAGLPITFSISCFLIFLNYLRKRKTLFQIQYAGGSIAFDVSYYAKAEIDDFQKQLRRIKDLAAESAEKITVAAPSHQAVVQNSSPTSVPDDLRKYAELLKDGLISQEEYDAVKKKTLGL